jgi:hypothetical protein
MVVVGDKSLLFAVFAAVWGSTTSNCADPPFAN